MKHDSKEIQYKKSKRYGASILASVALITLVPNEAMACSRWNFVCKAREAFDRAQQQARDAANRAADETRRQADAAKAAAEAAARETQRLKDIAEAEAKKLGRQIMQDTLDTAFGQLRSVGLNVLADAKNFTDPDLWLREITYLVLKDMAGQQVMDGGAETVSYIQNQLGSFSESAPFGNGPVGRQVQTEVEKAYKKALQNASQTGEKAIDYLNPLKNPLIAAPTDFNIAKDMYGFDMPSFLRFGYGTSFQIKPLDVTVDADKRLPVVLKGNVQTSFPLLWGDKNGASTIFVNAVNDHKFKFQVGAGAGIGSRKVDDKVYSDDRKASLQGGINFDVTCSTVVLGMCQLTKISSKQKLELQRKSGEELTGKIKKAMASMLMATGYLETFAVLSSGDRARLDAVLRQISSTIDQPLAIVDIAEKIIFVSQDVANSALSRQADIGAVGYIFAAMSAIDLPSQKWQKENWSKSTSTYKSAFSISDVESADISTLYEWYNADSVNNIFRPGFSFVGGSNPLPDAIGIEITKKIGTEAKFKIGNPDTKDAAGTVTQKANESEISLSANVNTAASFGVVLPLKSFVMNNFNALNGSVKTIAMTDELQRVISTSKGSFGDRVGLGASKQWGNPPELNKLEGELQLTDKLNIATYISISSN